jgi:hypothetical protein
LEYQQCYHLCQCLFFTGQIFFQILNGPGLLQALLAVALFADEERGGFYLFTL